jgi:signal transduction histidine kinase
VGLRVRVVLVVLSLLAIAALAVPLAWSSAARRTAALAEERGRQLTALADSAAVPGMPVQPLVDRYHEVYGEGVLIVDTDGQILAARGLTNAEPDVASAAKRALIDAPASLWPRILPWHTDPVLTAAGVRRDGELVGAVVVAVDTRVAARDVARGWGFVAVGCLGLLALAVLAARALTRWVLRPVDGLERAVGEMTEGVAGPPVDVRGPPELRHFTAAFNAMAGVVRASIDRQRRLVADASHQLRNPLAAIRLRADSLDDFVADGGRSTYGSMTAELDRLEHLLQQLLRLARAEEVSGSRRVGLRAAVAESADLDDVIGERIAFWQPVAEGQNQRLRHHDRPGLAVQVARHDVEQLLDVALDNALRYAGEGTTVTVSTVPAGAMVHLEVSDDGRGLPAEDLQRAAVRFWRGQDDGGAGTGLGLAIAGEIAAGHGGEIAVAAAPEGGLLVRFSLPMAGDAT